VEEVTGTRSSPSGDSNTDSASSRFIKPESVRTLQDSSADKQAREPRGSSAKVDDQMAGTPSQARQIAARLHVDNYARFGIPVATLGLMAAFALLSGTFLTGGNLLNILESAALPFVIAGGLTICLVMGEYDLSVSAASSLTTMVFSVWVAVHHMPTGVAIVLAIGVGLVCGLANGILVAVAGLSALVVTIATASIMNGMEFVVAHNQTIYGGYPAGLVGFARSHVAGVPSVVVLAITVGIVLWVLLERTVLGRQMRAVGGNRQAAIFAGVPVTRVRVVGFVICSVCAAISGIWYAAMQASATPLTGLSVLLPSFAAAFIGASAGRRLGQFNIVGTALGVLLAEIISNGLILLNVPPYANYIFQGAILLAALLFARFAARAQAARD
jgi:ribose transport system permease protein